MSEGNRQVRNREDMEPAMGTGEPPRAAPRKRRKWPLIAMGAGASVTIWAGWVRLGQMTGFGEVHPLPGIWNSFRLNTAITLPIGMEAYAAYGLGVWLDEAIPPRARKFAMWSSFAALLLGMTGQAASHLLAASHHTTAPGLVTVLVACLPVVVLGFGATLHHLQGQDEPARPAAGLPAPAAPPVSYAVEVEPPPVPIAEPVPLAIEGTAPVPPTPPVEPVPPREKRPAGSRSAGNRSAPAQTIGGRRVALQDARSLLPRAEGINNRHRSEHGRDISGDNLAAEMSVHKTTALALLRQIKAARTATSGPQAAVQ